ncbi:MAG: TfoX/Sxy family DNA transformation protein [Gemmobacter sp.]|uniref:TfoX/Sxy family DNA transformation protein n=1 Tax=Gemmobacter sp. TaxID=1898957 RepID=UPI00391C2C18
MTERTASPPPPAQDLPAGRTPISAIRNLGPATEAAFRRAGIADAETLRALGADAAYARLLAAGERPHFIGYYVLVMGLQGRPWNDCQGPEKAALRARFDAIKAAAAARPDAGLAPGMAAALDALGVVEPRPRAARPE